MTVRTKEKDGKRVTFNRAASRRAALDLRKRLDITPHPTPGQRAMLALYEADEKGTEQP